MCQTTTILISCSLLATAQFLIACRHVETVERFDRQLVELQRWKDAGLLENSHCKDSSFLSLVLGDIALLKFYCFRYEQSSVVSNAFQPIYLWRCTATSKTLRTMSMYARHVFKFSSYFTFAVTGWYILGRPKIKFPLPNTIVYTAQYLTTMCAQP